MAKMEYFLNFSKCNLCIKNTITNPTITCKKCFSNNTNVEPFPLPTVYTKFVLALYTGKKETKASNTITAQMVLSPLSWFMILFIIIFALVNQLLL
jgi:hypothetical protein